MPGAIFKTPEGEKFIDEEQFAEAVQLGYVPKYSINVIDSVTGDPVVVKPDEAADFFDARRPVNVVSDAYSEQKFQEKLASDIYGGVTNKILAGVAGGARGVSVGTSDAFLVGTGLAEAEDLRGLQDAHPGTSLVSEVGGAVLPAVLSGGTTAPASGARTAASLGARALRATPAGQVARLGTGVSKAAGGGLKGTLAAGAAEGAVFGVGSAVSNAAISDAPFTAESLISEVGVNTLFGAGFGAAGGVLGYGLQKGGQKLLDRAVRKEAQSLSRESLESLQAVSGDAFSKLDDLAPKVFANADEIAGGVVKRVDEVSYQNALNQLDNLAQRGQGLSTALGKNKAAVTKVGKARAAINSADTVAGKKKAMAAYAETVNELATVTGLPKVKVKPQVNNFAIQAPKGFDEALKSARAAQKAYQAAGLGKNPIKGILGKDSLEEMLEAAKKFDDYARAMKGLDDMVGGGAFSAQLDDALANLSRQAQNIGGQGLSNMDLHATLVAFGISEAVLPDFEGPVDDLAKLALSHWVGKKFTSSRGGNAIKNMVRRGAGMAVRGAAYKGGGGVKGAAKAAIGEAAVGKIVDGMFAGQSAMARSAQNAQRRVERALGKLAKGTGKAISTGSPSTTAAILKQVNFEPEENVPKRETEEQSFKRVSEQLTRLAANHAALAQKLHNNTGILRQSHLKVGDEIVGYGMNVVAFLNERMPRDPGTLQYFGVSKWRPTAGERARFARHLRAVNDPIGILERMADGKMSREDADVLENVFPATYAKVQSFLIDNLPAVQELPYAHRIQLSSLFKVTADPTMARIQYWQQSFQNDAAQQGGLQQPTGTLNPPSTPETLAQQLSEPRKLDG